MTTPHHRSQLSLEGIINFESPRLLADNIRDGAETRFFSIMNGPIGNGIGNHVVGGSQGYNRRQLILHTYNYSLNRRSQDNLLQAFFKMLNLDLVSQDNEDLSNETELGKKIVEFADYLVTNFFLPIMAAGWKTPQPSPAPLAAIRDVLGSSHEYIGTPERISTLRRLCLLRDNYRCVITRIYDEKEAVLRAKATAQQGTKPLDDAGQIIKHPLEYLEVAHIIPHSLTQRDEAGLDEWKKAALEVLDMFDCGISHLIDGGNIDRPSNALTLTPVMHRRFGSFELYFDEVPDRKHTYRIHSFSVLPPEDLPVTRELFLSDNYSIEPPSRRLLAIHRAIAHVLHLSGAGEYIDKILRDMEDNYVSEDGSTSLGQMVNLRMYWLDGASESIGVR